MKNEQQSGEELVRVGDTVNKVIRFSERDMEAFASICGDWNPLHFDAAAAGVSRFGRKIASGAHTSSLLMGLLMSHCTRSTDGIGREAVALNFNFAFKAPVFADDDADLRWTISSREWNAKLGGWIAQADGTVSTGPSGTALVGRATLLVRAAASG